MNDEENRMVLTPEMCRAARAYLDWTQADLAERAAVSRGTVRDFEASAHGVHRSTPGLLRSALERGGAPLVTLEDGGLALMPQRQASGS
jgi:DNA-binding XRE family transcriptional regulator